MPVHILNEILTERKRQKPYYPVKVFAREAGISQPLLSLILSGKRSLTVLQAKKMSILLGLSEETERRLIDAALLASTKDVKLKNKMESNQKLREASILKPTKAKRLNGLEPWQYVPLLVLVDPSKVNEAKQVIRRFKQEMIALTTTGDDSEVYQLNVQFFPHTRK